MSFDLSNLTGVIGDVGKILPSTNDLANQVVTGALATVVLSGLKSSAGLDAVDPLHIIHKDGSQTMVGGKTISTSALNALDAAGKAAILAAGYTIVPG